MEVPLPEDVEAGTARLKDGAWAALPDVPGTSICCWGRRQGQTTWALHPAPEFRSQTLETSQQGCGQLPRGWDWDGEAAVDGARTCPTWWRFQKIVVGQRPFLTEGKEVN